MPTQKPKPAARVALPVRMTKAEHATLTAIAAEEGRTLTTVILRALRDAYPDQFPN